MTAVSSAWGIAVAGALLVAYLLVGVAVLEPRVGQPAASLLVTTGLVPLALTLDRPPGPRSLRDALRRLGLGRPAPRALGLAALYTLALAAFFPALAAFTGTPVGLRPGWGATLVATVALNGLAEEVVFRGVVFGGLRRTWPFRPAAIGSLLVFALAHLPLFLTSSMPVAVAGLATAAAYSVPLAWLFELGGRTIWAPALVHVGSHAIKLVSLDARVAAPALLAWMAIQVVAPPLAMAAARRAVARGERPASASAGVRAGPEPGPR